MSLFLSALAELYPVMSSINVCSFYSAAIIWSNWLADDLRDFPVASKGTRIEYRCSHKFRCECTCGIGIFSTAGTH